jgi:hypothetical protein
MRLVRATIYPATHRRDATEILLDRAPPGILDRSAPLDDAFDRGVSYRSIA